ncbi:hypothetical protein HMPREF1051_2229 [Neisseria sicca VK64]|uniref:Uncharacterized protein n=1 Tax=Neisseria sicca VK64 TaxID=1095748 RepID=I2NR42_NEISI|nr:hypothetical protein HMPREF1051_2229 [Neisseria sicca VK64]
MPCRTIWSAASSPCPDLKLIHYRVGFESEANSKRSSENAKMRFSDDLF